MLYPVKHSLIPVQMFEPWNIGGCILRYAIHVPGITYICMLCPVKRLLIPVEIHRPWTIGDCILRYTPVLHPFCMFYPVECLLITLEIRGPWTIDWRLHCRAVRTVQIHILLITRELAKLMVHEQGHKKNDLNKNK